MDTASVAARLAAEAQRIAQFGSWELDLRTHELAWSEEVFRIFEIDPARFDASYEAFLATVHPDDRELVDGTYRRAVESGEPYEVAHRLLLPDGRIKHVLERGESFYDAQGAPLRSIGTVQDVTERVLAEQEIRRTRDLLRAVLDASPDWISVKDREHRFLVVNRTYASAFGLEPEQMVGRTDAEFWPSGEPTEEIRAGDRAALEGNESRGEVGAVGRDGRRRIFESFKTALRDTSGHTYGVLGIARDVTERHEAAVEQRRALDENRTLLAEIHHRVKNNLQVICSLLALHASHVEDPRLQAAFDEARQRVRSMALVHEHLSQSKSLASVDLAEHIRSLVAMLAVSNRDRPDVELVTEVPSLPIPMDVAMPLGLVVTELLSNAYKHAFAPRRRGRIGVEGTSDGRTLTLTVRDDGVGLPPGVRIESTRSLGFRLARTLVEQLHGHIELASSVQGVGGTTATVTIPIAS